MSASFEPRWDSGAEYVNWLQTCLIPDLLDTDPENPTAETLREAIHWMGEARARGLEEGRADVSNTVVVLEICSELEQAAKKVCEAESRHDRNNISAAISLFAETIRRTVSP